MTDRSLEVVDCTQRLWSIWEFIDDQYQYGAPGNQLWYSELPVAQRRQIRDYELQVTILEDAPDEYLRELFLRLQLGLLLVTGEKLNAATGSMREFVFKKVVAQSFIDKLRIPRHRYAKQTLGAQIAINSFSRAKIGVFARTRYEDLLAFFKEYEKPVGQDLLFFRQETKNILRVLDELSTIFGERAAELSNRSYILSVYMLFQDCETDLGSTKARKTFLGFVFALWSRLKQEAKAGIDRQNRELYSFENLLSSAPGEKYQIERRHEKLLEYYGHFRETGKIKGDS